MKATDEPGGDGGALAALGLGAATSSSATATTPSCTGAGSPRLRSRRRRPRRPRCGHRRAAPCSREWCTARSTTRSPRWKETWSRSRPTSPHRRRLGRSRGRAGGARRPGRPRSGPGGERPVGVRRLHGDAPGGARERRWQGGRRRRRGGDARPADGRPLRRRRPLRADTGRPGSVRADRSDVPPGRRGARRRCGRSPTTRLPTGPTRRTRITSKQYAEDVAEVQLLGRNTVDHAHGPADRDGPVLHRPDLRPVQPRPAAAQRRARARRRESARLLGYTWVAVADTMIACWEAKYHYMFWRPNHAIQRADHRTPDPTWLPLVTGNHPEYPSGHACFTAGVTKSLQEYFGTQVARADAHEHGDRHDADVHASRPARRGRRGRPRLGRAPLPHDDDRDGQALPADRARTSQGPLPRRTRGNG